MKPNTASEQTPNTTGNLANKSINNINHTGTTPVFDRLSNLTRGGQKVTDPMQSIDPKTGRPLF